MNIILFYINLIKYLIILILNNDNYDNYYKIEFNNFYYDHEYNYNYI